MRTLIILLMSLILPVSASAQAQINTKKIKIADFTQKITKIVLTGDELMDGMIEDEIASRWRISPYEFCSLKEFESLKTNSNYYFLLTTDVKFRKDDDHSLQFMSLVKGGAEAADGINKMLEIVSIPIAPAEYPTGRELIFLPVFIEIIQSFTLDSMERDLNGYAGLGSYNHKISRTGEKNIVFADCDMSQDLGKSLERLKTKERVSIEDEDSVSMHIERNTPNTVVSYTVAPTDATNGSFCYKMLVDAETYELYYFKRHRISEKSGQGFLESDLSRIISAQK